MAGKLRWLIARSLSALVSVSSICFSTQSSFSQSAKQPPPKPSAPAGAAPDSSSDFIATTYTDRQGKMRYNTGNGGSPSHPTPSPSSGSNSAFQNADAVREQIADQNAKSVAERQAGINDRKARENEEKLKADSAWQDFDDRLAKTNRESAEELADKRRAMRIRDEIAADPLLSLTPMPNTGLRSQQAKEANASDTGLNYPKITPEEFNAMTDEQKADRMRLMLAVNNGTSPYAPDVTKKQRDDQAYRDNAIAVLGEFSADPIPTAALTAQPAAETDSMLDSLKKTAGDKVDSMLDSLQSAKQSVLDGKQKIQNLFDLKALTDGIHDLTEPVPRTPPRINPGTPGPKG